MKTRTRWPEGTRVEFKPNAASLGMYSSAPPPGARGSVVAVSVGRGKVTYLKGPGGGLVYVNWDKMGVLGVSPIDVVALKKTSGKTKSNPAPKAKPKANPKKIKRTIKSNPTLVGSAVAATIPLKTKRQVHDSILVLNNLYLKGKISDEDYKHVYEIIAKAWKKFGLSGVPSNELQDKPAPNPAKRHLPVMQPYSEEWRKRRAAGIAQPNPAGPIEHNDPSGMRAIMMKAMSKPNPVAKEGNPQMAVRLAVAEIGIEASSVGKNISSIDPQEYLDAFMLQGKDPDAAMASLEDMASWGVTDLI